VSFGPDISPGSASPTTSTTSAPGSTTHDRWFALRARLERRLGLPPPPRGPRFAKGDEGVGEIHTAAIGLVSIISARCL